MSIRTLFAANLAFFAIAATAAPASAHHSFSAEFDAKKPIAVEGVVTKARFVNPHSWIYLDVRDKKGAVTNWGFEFGSTSSLRANGVEKADVAPGTSVKIKGFLARNGGPFGYATAVVLGDGREVKTGGAPNAPDQIAVAR